MKSHGFTLMEVLVALAVLGASSAVFFRYIDGFQRQRNMERSQVQAFICSTQTMESLVRQPPDCDAVLTTNAAPVANAISNCPTSSYSLSKVPGLAPLLVATVFTDGTHPIKLRRFIQCKK